jgi:hypothetical protein
MLLRCNINDLIIGLLIYLYIAPFALSFASWIILQYILCHGGVEVRENENKWNSPVAIMFLKGCESPPTFLQTLRLGSCAKWITQSWQSQ